MIIQDVDRDNIRKNLEKAEVLIEALPYIRRFNISRKPI